MHKTHPKSFVFETLFIGDNSSTFYLFDGKVLLFLASKLEHFENDMSRHLVHSYLNKNLKMQNLEVLRYVTLDHHQ